MNRSRLFILAIACLGAFSAPALAQHCLDQTTIAHGAMSGFDADRTCDMDTATACGGADLVIRDPNTWAKFWAIHNSHFSPPPPLPEVNFRTQVVLASFLGERRTTFYSTEITCVTPAPTDLALWAKRLQAQVTDVSPGPDCIVNPTLTNPYHIVVLSTVSSSGPVALKPVLQRMSVDFVHEDVTVNCPGGDDDGLCRICPDNGGLGGLGEISDIPCCP